MSNKRHVTLAGVVALWLAPAASHAQNADYPPSLNEKFVLNDSDPESSLPTEEQMKKNPLEWGYLIMTLDERAQIAVERKDWAQALKYHRAAAKMVPDRAVSFALVSKDYEMLGKREEALEACGEAVALPGAKLDYFASFVHLVANRKGGVDNGEAKDALEAIEHLKKSQETLTAAYELQCELGLQMRDDGLLDECSRELLQRAPSAPRPVSFAWALALQRGDLELAKKLIDEARRKGATPSSLEKMEKATQAVTDGATFDSPRASAGIPGGANDGDDSGKPVSLGNVWHSMSGTAKWALGAIAALLGALVVARKLPRSAA